MGCGGGLRGKEGILWGMPGESQETLRAAPCACVELISSPLPFCPLLIPPFPLPLLRSRVLAAPEESTESLGTWPRCLFAPTHPLPPHRCVSCSTTPSSFVFLLILLSCRRSLSFAVVSSSFSSLYGSFSFLRCCVLHSQYWHPLIKPSLTHSLCFHLSVSISLCIFISLPSLLALASSPVWHVFLFPSLVLLPSRFPRFTSPRLIFPIERPLIKLYFVSPCGFSEHFGESRFHDAHAVAIACLAGSRGR